MLSNLKFYFTVFFEGFVPSRPTSGAAASATQTPKKSPFNTTNNGDSLDTSELASSITTKSLNKAELREALVDPIFVQTLLSSMEGVIKGIKTIFYFKKILSICKLWHHRNRLDCWSWYFCFRQLLSLSAKRAFCSSCQRKSNFRKSFFWNKLSCNPRYWDQGCQQLFYLVILSLYFMV